MAKKSNIADRIPAPLIFVGSGLSQYSGAAIATLWLFTTFRAIIPDEPENDKKK